MDNIFKKHGFLICSLFSLILGALIFILFFGYKILNPFYIDWILSCNYDLSETYLGWYYFFHSSWDFPLGLFNSLSYPVKTSILNTDSIPIMAIFFKLFKNVLPDNFQYWGIYTLICYMMQSFLGMVIIRKFTKNDFWGNLIAILSGVIFCLMPYITVFSFWHSTVVCHFLIIACFIPAIYKFNLKSSILLFGLIGFLSASITPYIMAICAVILLVYSIYLFWDKKDFKQFIPFVFFILCSIPTLYIIGAFEPTSSFSHVSLSEYSFNLNGFFNSQGYMKFFSNLKIAHLGQMQGYAYFGLGILVLIGFCIFNIAHNFIKDKINFSKYKKEAVFITALIILSVILALSPKVTFSNIVLFEIPLPDFISNIWSIFRSTGKFIWIANYAILILVLGCIVKHFSKIPCLIILFICISIQMVDFSVQFKEKSNLKQEIVYRNKYSGYLFDSLKNENNIKKIYIDKSIYDYSDSDIPAYIMIELVSWMRSKKVKFNAFYFARPMKYVDYYYFDRLKNPQKGDIFIFLRGDYRSGISHAKKLKHFYVYQDIIIASTDKLNGLDEIEMPYVMLLNKP